MNYIDLVLVVILGLSAWQGIRKGFIIEIFSILALFAGIYGAIHFSDVLAVWMRDELELKKEWLPIASFAGTFLLIVIGVQLLAKAVSKFIDLVALSWLNKAAGAVFSLIKAAIILSFILMLVTPFTRSIDFPPRKAMNNSVLYAPIANIAPTILPMIEDSEFYKYLKENGWVPWEKKGILDQEVFSDNRR